MAQEHDAARLAAILRGLSTRESGPAWADFLGCFAPLILSVVRTFERDADSISDCFLFVCEQLSRSGFRRLRRFQPDGPASFSTWLRVVVRNLCLDWHRKEFGRYRAFRFLTRFSPLEREVFHCVYEQGLSLETAFVWLSQKTPGLTRDGVVESLARVEAALSSRQRWLLTVRRGRSAPKSLSGEEAQTTDLVDPEPGPETLACLEERKVAVEQALRSLSPSDRLLIRFRFEEDLTLEQIAGIMGLGDAQGADRKIRKLLEMLRGHVEQHAEKK